MYSRNGKGTYSGEGKFENICVGFEMKDLQSRIETCSGTGNTISSGKEWKWTFMDDAIKNKIPQYYTQINKEDCTLVFESRFESGNLGLAVRLSSQEYILLMQNDTITKGNTQCNARYDSHYRVLFQH